MPTSLMQVRVCKSHPIHVQISHGIEKIQCIAGPARWPPAAL